MQLKQSKHNMTMVSENKTEHCCLVVYEKDCAGGRIEGKRKNGWQGYTQIHRSNSSIFVTERLETVAQQKNLQKK